MLLIEGVGSTVIVKTSEFPVQPKKNGDTVMSTEIGVEPGNVVVKGGMVFIPVALGIPIEAELGTVFALQLYEAPRTNPSKI